MRYRRPISVFVFQIPLPDHLFLSVCLAPHALKLAIKWVGTKCKQKWSFSTLGVTYHMLESRETAAKSSFSLSKGLSQHELWGVMNFSWSAGGTGTEGGDPQRQASWHKGSTVDILECGNTMTHSWAVNHMLTLAFYRKKASKPDRNQVICMRTKCVMPSVTV